MDNNNQQDRDRDNLDLKLELIRTDLRAGLTEIRAILNAQTATMEKEALKVTEIEERLRSLEMEAVRAETKFKILGLIVSISSGGAGALLSKLF